MVAETGVDSFAQRGRMAGMKITITARYVVIWRDGAAVRIPYARRLTLEDGK
jgi:hypothetical protein